MTDPCCDCRCPKGSSGHEHPAADHPEEPEPIVAPASPLALVVLLVLSVLILVLACLVLAGTAQAAEPCDPVVQSCVGDDGEPGRGGAPLALDTGPGGWRIVSTGTASCAAERQRAAKAERDSAGWRRSYEGAYHNQVEAEQLARERGLDLGKALVDLGDCRRQTLSLTREIAGAPPPAPREPSSVAAVVRTVLIVGGAAAGATGGAVLCREVECRTGATAGVTAGSALAGAGLVAIAAWAWGSL